MWVHERTLQLYAQHQIIIFKLWRDQRRKPQHAAVCTHAHSCEKGWLETTHHPKEREESCLAPRYPVALHCCRTILQRQPIAQPHRHASNACNTELEYGNAILENQREPRTACFAVSRAWRLHSLMHMPRSSFASVMFMSFRFRYSGETRQSTRASSHSCRNNAGRSAVTWLCLPSTHMDAGSKEHMPSLTSSSSKSVGSGRGADAWSSSSLLAARFLPTAPCLPL